MSGASVDADRGRNFNLFSGRQTRNRLGSQENFILFFGAGTNRDFHSMALEIETLFCPAFVTQSISYFLTFSDQFISTLESWIRLK